MDSMESTGINDSVESTGSNGVLMGSTPRGLGSDPQKRIRIEQQLHTILHSIKCLQRGEDYHCSLPNCAIMKNVLTHMKTCTSGKSCPVPHCSSSRQIWTHWQNCVRTHTYCIICSKFKGSTLPVTTGVPITGRLVNQLNGSHQTVRQWETSPDLRSQTVATILATRLSKLNLDFSSDLNIRSSLRLTNELMSYSRALEDYAYKRAVSLEHYYYLAKLSSNGSIVPNPYLTQPLMNSGLNEVIEGFDCLVLDSSQELDN